MDGNSTINSIPTMDIMPPTLQELANLWNYTGPEWNWTDSDWDYIYSEPIGIWESLIDHFLDHLRSQRYLIQTDLLLYPALVYFLNLACLAIAFNSNGRYRTAFVGASLAFAAAIIQQISVLPVFYAVKITIVQVLVIQNMGAAVMMLWENIAVTEEQKKLPWGQRILATYKLMWNARFVNTARPAPVLHLIKAEEERKRQLAEATITATIGETATKKATMDNKDLYKTLTMTSNNKSMFDRINHSRDLVLQLSYHAWNKVSQPLARSWNSLSPRSRWIMATIAKITLVFILEHVKEYLWDTYAWFSHDDIALYKRSYFRRLIRNETDLREVVIRCYFAFEGLWGAFYWYTFIHSTVALFFVALHIDEPEEWPPVFGDIREGWNLRRFWSKFFDRLIYRTTNGLGEIILTTLGVGRRPFRGNKRWVLNGLIFFLSGTFHAGTEYICGIKCHVGVEIWWWMLNYITMIMETAFLYGLQTYFPRFYYKMSGRVGKAIGYLWLFTFQFYASPKNQYTALNCLPQF
ncbi:hypothetical protein BDP81DRAFT_432963 [Colletotrichum phormii]|uniref:Wax synthase domain-containing protein n=1 Tax=Colletotrichum phormii TaxID=359342 RepID=A0AAJ0EEX0_9PEZI|nr:uncharacterized protein BDP81DRAFT_432963 [Colletotrichum phormii]KAK1634511.1 hypothetical protein BDP81DRAFT_432963 [Colletotrichum phormii]